MISIIVTIYNSEEYLQTCISSIINQTYKDIEIILVNDGSSDNSIDICNRFMLLDSRIKVIDNKINKGIVEARKNGVNNSKGEYITFVDADDWIEKDAYQYIMDSLKGETPDLVAYGMKEEKNGIIAEKKNSIMVGYYDKESISCVLKNGCLYNNSFFKFGILPNLCCKLIKKDIFIHNMNEVSSSITIGEDVDFFYRILPELDDMIILDYTPYHYIQYNDSMMRKDIPFGLIKDLYNDLISISSFDFMKQEWNNQVLVYILFVTLLKCPNALFARMPELTEIDGDVVVYGAGDFGSKIYHFLSECNNNVNVKVVDRNWENIHRIDFMVYTPDIINKDIDIVIVGILDEGICKSIKNTFIEKGYDNIMYIVASESNIQLLKKLLE